MSQSIFPGPIASENNPPIEPQWFQPSRFQISAISSGVTTTVTTLPAFGVNNNYVIGQQIRFNIPPLFGIRQLNGQQGYVIGLPATNQVIVNINTSQGYDSFISNPIGANTPPSIIAIGDVNTGPININPTNSQTYVQGSFINISPT